MHYGFILPFLRIILISQLQRYRLCIASLWKSYPEETSSGANYSFAPKAWLIFNKVRSSSLSSSYILWIRNTKKKIRACALGVSSSSLCLYQVLSIIFIYVWVTPILIDWDLYIEVLKNLLLNLGLLEAKLIKWDSNIYILLGYSHNSIYGFRTCIIIVLILFIIFPLLFIIQNYIFIILSLLSAILVKALALNFYKKHLGASSFFYGDYAGHTKGSKWAKLLGLVRQIINNIDKIIKHLFKIWIISVIIVFIFRSLIATMLLNLDNNSFISTILILTLPLPIFLYLLNFIVKYLKKQPIEDEDYYLYNNYVVDRVNLYRISYIIFINYLIRAQALYCYSISIWIITMGIIVILITLFIIYISYGLLQIYKQAASRQSVLSCRGQSSSLQIFWRSTENIKNILGGELRSRQARTKSLGTVINKHEPLALKAAPFESSAAYITAFIALTPFFQEGCNKGFMEYYLNTGNAKYCGDWKRVIFKTPGVLKIGSTVNIMENKKIENTYAVEESRQKDLLRDYRSQLDKSPIINMTWRLRYNEGVQRSQDKFTVKPLSYFTNPQFYGAVSLVLKGRFLIVNIIRRDSPGCVFVPTYYLPDKNDPKSLTKILQTVQLLERKYGIVLPSRGAERLNNRTNGLVIYTQAESIDSKSLFRVWRPSIHFTEPEFKTVNNYYKVKSKDVLRLRDFETADSVMLAKSIREMVKVHNNYLNKHESGEKLVHQSKSLAESVTKLEYMVDKNYRQLVEFYITKGQEANPKDFKVLKQDRTDKHTLKYYDLLERGWYKTRSQIAREKSLLMRGGDKDIIEVMKAKLERCNRNYVYLDRRSHFFETRRDYPINSLLLTANNSHMTQFSIYKNGVVEGYRERQQLLGKLDSSIILPLVESRIELIKKIASNLTKSEYQNLNLGACSHIYGVSINRLTYEFFELKPTKSIYFGISERDGTSQQWLDKNMDCEVYSIIDLKNDSLKLRALLNEGESFDLAIPKHDYNLLDNKDELSIRRFMDFIYPNSDEYLTYQSHKDNFSVLTQKSVGFSKKALDYKGKQPRGVNYTKYGVLNRVIMEKKLYVELPFDSDKLLNNSPNKYHGISLKGKRVMFNYEPKRIFIEKGGPVISADFNINTIRFYDGNTMVKSKDNTLVKSKGNLVGSGFEEYYSIFLNKPKPKGIITSGTILEVVATYPAEHTLPVFRLLGYNNISIDSQSRTGYTENTPVMTYSLKTSHYRTDTTVPEESINSTVIHIESPLAPSIPMDVDEDEDIYGYSGDEDDNSAVAGASAVQAAEPWQAIIPSRPMDVDENEDIYGYSGDEDDNSAVAGASAVQAAEQPEAILATEDSLMELPLEDSPGYMPYSEEAESPDDNASDSSHSTVVPSAGQVGESEEVTLVSADDICIEEAPSPHFFIPEPTPEYIPSYSYSPVNTQEPNVLNREAMELDADLVYEVMMNASAQAAIETLDPILLYPSRPGNPEPVQAEDSPLSSIGDSELDELEQIFNRGASSALREVDASEEQDAPVEARVLQDNPRSNDIEPKSLTSEPLEDKDLMNSSNLASEGQARYINEGGASNFGVAGIHGASHISYSGFQDREVNMTDGSDSEGDSSDKSSSPNSVVTVVPWAGQVGESEEVTLVSADDISREEAPSPHFFIPEPTPEYIPSYSYSPVNTQEPNVLNREAMELDADLVNEVMMNASAQAAIETLDPILLYPSQPSNPEPPIETIDPLTSGQAGEIEEATIIPSGENSSSEGVPSPHGKVIDRDNAGIASPGIQPGQDNTGMDIDEDSLHADNPEGNVLYDTCMDIDEDSSHEENQEGRADRDSFLDFDPCGAGTDFFGYDYHQEVVRRCEQEALNIQARYEDLSGNSQVPSPLNVDTEAQPLPIINTSYQSGESADDRNRVEVATTAPSDTQASQEETTDDILEPNVLNQEAMELDADLVNEVMMNASGQAAIGTIDPILLYPSQSRTK